MAWKDCVLSTPGSLARIEREVNKLAGTASRLCYVGDGAATISFPKEIASILWLDENGVETRASVYDEWTVPEDFVCGVKGRDEAGEVIAEYPCDEGAQLVCRDISGNANHARLSTTNLHGSCETATGWLDKIALAREMLDRKLESALAGRAVRVDEASGRTLLDAVTNPRTFALASDYLSLHLIYTDLAADMGKELWFRKAEWYRRQFDANFSAALRQMKLDTNADGLPNASGAELFDATRITR